MFLSDLFELKRSLLSFKESLDVENSSLIVDFRLWHQSVNGLIQEGRSDIEVLKNKTPIKIGDYSYNFFEACHNSNERQYIDYRIVNLNLEQETSITLSYLKFSINQFIDVAKQAGFNSIDIHYNYLGIYPYIIAILK